MIHNLSTLNAFRESAVDQQQDRVAQILDEYLRAVERGESLTPQSLLERYPEQADRLAGYLSGLQVIQDALANPGPHLLTMEQGARGHELRGRLGDFQLVREIGRGGMGVVYEAWQLSLQRRVALKILPFSAAIDERQITRFQNEAQAAAQVDHPHIVPVFAIGQEHGIHYFAMQFIGGQSLCQLLEDRRADAADESGAVGGKLLDKLSHGTSGSRDTANHVASVARMGVQVAEALHAAHEIGVVHRDVKPSNLLVDEQGKVWISDFGVARCKTSPGLTATGDVLGTTRYMSPEQAAGQAALVDQRTDIYSLGVTLYELATLRHPFEGMPNTPLPFEMGRGRPARLRQWNRHIPTDLEIIVLKAMAEGREERYSTARELADDLNRFLSGEPILAQRPSLTTRLGKWAARHKQMVAVAAGVVMLAVVGLVASLIVISRERAEKDQAYQNSLANHERAEARFHQAQEMLDRFGNRVAQRLASVPGAEGVRKELLSEMLPYYREFARETSDGPAMQSDLALTYSKIGFLSEQLGSPADAEQAYQDARAILEQLTANGSTEPQHLRSLALANNNLGQLVQKRGDIAAAAEYLGRALRIQQDLVDGAPSVAEYRIDLATTLSNLGLLLSQTGKSDDAAQRYRAAIAIQESIRDSAPKDTANLNNLAASYNNLGSLYMTEPVTAREWVEKALGLQTELVRDNPTQRVYQSDLALSYNNLGAILARLKQWSDAERCYQDAIAIQQRLVAAAPLMIVYRRDLSVSYNNLGMAQSNAKRLPEAEATFGKALDMQKALVEKQPKNISLLSALAGIYNNLGFVHQNEQQYAQACEAFEQAIAAQRRAFEQAPNAGYFRDSLSKHLYNYAQVLRLMNRPQEAAAVVLERRKLWAGNADRLYRVAEELAATCGQMDAASADRQQYLDETLATLEQSAAAGLAKAPDWRAAPFDVLSGHPKLTSLKLKMSLGGAN